MGVSLIYNKNSKLTSIEDLISKDENDVKISTEDLNVKLSGPTPGGEEGCCSDKGKAVSFTKIVDKNNVAKWTFFISAYKPIEQYTEFILSMTEVTAQDSVFIYGPSTCSTNLANALASAILTCASKDITISIPYVFNLGSAYVLSFANKISYSPYDIMICKLDEIVIGGGVQDTVSTLDMHKHKFTTMLKRLQNKGLLTTKEVDHIQNAQGQVVCYCNDLVERYKNFNNK